MHFDLFYELSVPDQLGCSEQQIFSQALDEISLADSLDYKTAWLVEHHYMKGYSHSSAPELFLAALSQRTKKIRLGHAIVPLPYNHPIRVAERAATLDILSNGRLEFGFGRGFSPKEYDSFGVAMSDSRTITQESFEIIKKSFAGDAINYEGKHYNLHDIELFPKVLQQPHPPLWTAAVSPSSYEMAAQLGIGAMVGPFKPWFMVKEDIKLYRRSWSKFHSQINTQASKDTNTTVQTATNNPALNPKVAMTVGILCLEDEKRAHEIGKPAFEWFYRNLLQQTSPVLKNLHESYEYYKSIGKFQGLLSKTVNLKVLETFGLVIVGNPEHCVKKLKKLEAASVDHVLLAIGAGAIDTAVVKESMQLINDQVIPHFKHSD
ncbi:MAG: LLM class flavin-dependent oxidoreductase [Gammaproteobacteria bacterium]|nr:LLM class flavin-dependent oxidoreductase [Gammaproteobacteria bacterium]